MGYTDIADVYDFFIPDPPGMIAFYKNLAAQHATGPILEIGCGTGRLTLRFAATGYSVVALDLSPAMLRVLSNKLLLCPEAVSKNVIPVEGDQRCFALDDRYSLIVVTGGTLQHCLSLEDYDSTVRTIRRHLLPGGILAFDIECPDIPDKASHYRQDFPVCSGTSFGKRWHQILSWNENTVERSGILSTHACFEIRDEDGSLVDQFCFDTRYTVPITQEMKTLLERHQFSDIKITEGFDKNMRLLHNSNYAVVARNKTP
jgi:SAM-dependent methyltransferase